MIKHIVMWNINEDESKEVVMNALKERLENLKCEIDFIQALEVGFNYNVTAQAHDVVLYSEFLTKEDLDAYVVHPAHKRVGEYVRSVVKDRVVVDYEI
ncbi:MAG: stress responsive protein [Firmicutes bacterium HGW-Firmicutes-1]|nr:MAG: stress responsive protein [Firmicutes bacterium HGW-Firmicutes-1]